MIITIDGLNRDRYGQVLEDMFQLRGRVFRDRLGWEVTIDDQGREIDAFDSLDPVYLVRMNDKGNVVGCLRLLQTTGPHMLSDVFHEILDGAPPLRDPLLWESTRFCVDTERLEQGRGANSIAQATSELQIGALELGMEVGLRDIVTVVDPIMNRVLIRSGNKPYDYVGSTKPMGKVKAMAALMDCTPERVAAIRDKSGIDYNIFLDEDVAENRFGGGCEPALQHQTRKRPQDCGNTAVSRKLLSDYCLAQLSAATDQQERDAAVRLAQLLFASEDADLENSAPQQLH